MTEPVCVQMSTFLLFVLPVLLITWFYVLIGLKLRRSRDVGRSLGLTTSCYVSNVQRTTSRFQLTTASGVNGDSSARFGRLAAPSSPRKSIVKMLGNNLSYFIGYSIDAYSTILHRLHRKETILQ